VGLAGVLLLARLAGPGPEPGRAGAPRSGTAAVVAVALLAVLALHGSRFHAEPGLRAFAAEIRAGVQR
jgi:hypothetical protein